MWAFPPEERANHQGWDESEEGPVNQNEWAPLRALVSTRPRRSSQPPPPSPREHGALGVKRDPDALLHKAISKPHCLRCRVSISHFLSAHLPSVTWTAGQNHWNHYWIFLFYVPAVGSQAFVSDVPPQQRGTWVHLIWVNSNTPW